MLGVILFIRSIFGDWNKKKINKKICHIEDIDSSKSNLKSYSSSDDFLQSFGSLKIDNLAMLWTSLDMRALKILPMILKA